MTYHTAPWPITRSPHPPITGVFLERIKRFTVRVWLPEQEEECIAHLGDPGRLLGILQPGTTLLLDGPFPTTHRQTAYTAILAHREGTWVSLDTQLPNRLLAPLLLTGHLPTLWHPPLTPAALKREVNVGNSRLDAQIGTGGTAQYVECKCVTWADGELALFPDAPTKRGQKHLQECIELVKKGHRTTVLLVAGRDDVTQFAPADDIDPVFAEQYRRAIHIGVSVLGVSVKLTPEGAVYSHALTPLLSDPRHP